MTYQDEYDPDLHGDRSQPSTRLGTAIAIAAYVLIAAAILWWIVA